MKFYTPLLVEHSVILFDKAVVGKRDFRWEGVVAREFLMKFRISMNFR